MTTKNIPKGWHIFRGTKPIPAAPPWRKFGGGDGAADAAAAGAKERARFIFEDPEIDLINAALYLRRPLLVTGKPGVGKSTLIHDVARELKLGKVLTWPINTRSTLEQGLYRYDAIGRLQELEAARNAKKEGAPEPPPRSEEDEARDALGRFITLGPLGTAFLPTDRPRALLIDEIDKSDIDLPNDLLNLFEEGSYEIPVLVRSRDKWRRVPVGTSDGGEVVIENGIVRANEFPFVVMTSNGERDFPQPFLRRCIRLQIEPPDPGKLEEIVREHLPDASRSAAKKLIDEFYRRSQSGVDLATDQLLNAVLLTTKYSIDLGKGKDSLYEHLLRDLKT